MADHTEVLLLYTLVNLEVSRVVELTDGIFDFYSGGAMRMYGMSLDHRDSEGWWHHWNEGLGFWNVPGCLK